MPSAPVESAVKMFPAPSPHAALIRALAGDDPEPILERAFAQLGRGGDLPLLLATAAALARCGLGGIATRLLTSSGAAVAAHPQTTSMLAELRRLPTGAIDTEVIRDRFRSNVSLVIKRSPALAAMLDPAQPPRDVTIYRSRTGNVHALREQAGGPWQWVFPFIDQRAQAAAMQLPQSNLDTSIALIGVPSAPLLERLLKMNAGDYRPPIDILETDLEALGIWLGMLDRVEMLDEERVLLFAGTDAAARYADWLVSAGDRGAPTMILTNHRAGWLPPKLDEAWRRDVATRSAARRCALSREMNRRWCDGDGAHWQQRFGESATGTRTLRIIGFTNRYSTVIQHSMRRLAAAFERAGHQFEVIGQANDYTSGIDVAGVLSQRDFDLIVAINHLRFEYADSMPANVPFVGWIQDHMDHLWRREAGQSIGEHDLVITHAPDVLAGLYGYRRDRMLASSNLTDASTFSAERLPEADLAPHRCDLSFVSHGAATPEALVEEIALATTPAFGRMLRDVLTRIRGQLQPAGCLNAQQLVELMLEAERSSGHTPLPRDVRRSVVYPHVGRIHDRVYRHQTLEWAATWARSRRRRFRIYGRGWPEHPTLAEYAAGEIDSGIGLRAVYQASAISLQANAYSSLHQRLLDGVACGAMIISRWNPADFVRQSFARVRQAIIDHRLTTLSDLVELRTRDDGVAAACDEIERLSGVVLATLDDAGRREQVRSLREANDIAEIQTDDGLFSALRDMRYLAGRSAGEIPGFQQTVFNDKQQMHAMLDRLVDAPAEREAIVRPMRESVLAHDTVDALVGRIIDALARGEGS